jgi:hypothetical protein
VASPTATLFSAPPVVTGGSTTSFVIRYADDRAIKNSSINYGDVQVTGPNGFVQTAAFYGVDVNANGPTRDGTYFVSAPGGAWDVSENGTYLIHMVTDQVFDVVGNTVPAMTLGSFTVNVPPVQTQPPGDMTELNAGDWFAFAVAATASTSDDAVRKTFGAASVRFDTTGGFDTYLRYEPASGTLWDLTSLDMFRFDVYAENPSAFDFQQEPIVRFIDADGDAMEFRYWQTNSPYPLWNDAIGSWMSQTIFIKSTAQPATGWRGTPIGTPDWSRMTTVEIHADTWDFGFTLWFDRMGFTTATSSMAPFIDGDQDVFINLMEATSTVRVESGRYRERSTFNDSQARHEALLVWLASFGLKPGERSNDMEIAKFHASAGIRELNSDGLDRVFRDLVFESFG